VTGGGGASAKLVEEAVEEAGIDGSDSTAALPAETETPAAAVVPEPSVLGASVAEMGTGSVEDPAAMPLVLAVPLEAGMPPPRGLPSAAGPPIAGSGGPSVDI
jgi:hypothetical protein